MRTARILPLAALLCLLASACGSLRYTNPDATTRHNPDLNVNVHLPGEENGTSRHTFASRHPEGSVKYIVDGQQYYDEVTTEEDIATLYLKILGYAKLGHNVSITASANTHQDTTADAVTYTSSSEAQVASWAARMVRKGYSVKIEYDKSAKTYTCTASKKK